MSNVVKFPYSASRRVHSKMPRRSKNGTPEERAASAAATQSPPASIVPFADRDHSPEYPPIDRRKLRSSPLREKSPISRSPRRSLGRYAPPILKGKICLPTRQAGAKNFEQVRPPRGTSPMNSTKRRNAFS
jgi:hypothetical protein